MAAWADMDGWYDRAEAYSQHVTDEAFYPECSVEEACAAIDEATATFEKLADETAELVEFFDPRRSTAGSSPALGYHQGEAA